MCYTGLQRRVGIARGLASPGTHWTISVSPPRVILMSKGREGRDEASHAAPNDLARGAQSPCGADLSEYRGVRVLCQSP